MMMHVLVFCYAEVASEEERFDTLEKRGVSRHHVNELAVLRAGLAHDNLAILFDDLRFDFTWMLMHQSFKGRLAGNYSVANLFHAGGTQTVGLAREAERRSGAFIRLQQWTGGPLGMNRLSFGQSFVNCLKRRPRRSGKS